MAHGLQQSLVGTNRGSRKGSLQGLLSVLCCPSLPQRPRARLWGGMRSILGWNVPCVGNKVVGWLVCRPVVP
eukprot:12910132-Prorocentrum_lima.AAC.1